MFIQNDLFFWWRIYFVPKNIPMQHSFWIKKNINCDDGFAEPYNKTSEVDQWMISYRHILVQKNLLRRK